MSEYNNLEVSHWYNQYSKLIHNYIYKIIRDHHEAEDLTQETFLKAFTFFNSYGKKASPKTWLYKIAHNVTVDYLRKKRPVLLREDEEVENRKDPSLHPEDILGLQEDSEKLYRALGSLKPAYRNVIVLRRLKECSIRETSERLLWSEGKVKSTLPRAMSRLEKELMENGYKYEYIV